MSGRLGLIETAPSSVLPPADVGGDTMGDVDPHFSLFVSHGFASLTGEETDRVPVTILRDTGAYHSLLLESVLPLSEQSSCGSNILVWGIKMSVTSTSVHMVFLQSPLVSGYVKVAVHTRLPIAGVSFILGNNLAGGRVFPSPEILGIHISAADPASLPLGLFSSCAITRAQARKMEGVVDLENSFLATADGGHFRGL